MAATAGTVLPPDTPAVAEVQAAWTNDMDATRKRLANSLLRTSDGTFLVAPAAGSATTEAKGNKVNVTRTGNPLHAKAMTLAELTALGGGVTEVILNIFGGPEAAPLELRCNGLRATLQPVRVAINAELNQLLVSVGYGDAQEMDLEDAVHALGLEWQPWGGVPAGPPQAPAAPGILSAAAASTRDMPCTEINGAGAMGPMRGTVLATIGVIAAGDTRVQVGDIAAFLATLAETPRYRQSVMIAIASAMAAGESGQVMTIGSTLLAASTAVGELLQAAQAVIDLLGMEDIQSIVANTEKLRASGLNVGPSHVGGYVASALAQAADGGAARAQAANAAGVAAQDGVLAAVMARISMAAVPVVPPGADLRAQAALQLDSGWATVASGATPLAGVRKDEAVAAIAAQLAALTTVPAGGGAGGAPAPAPPTPAASGAAVQTAFMALRPHGGTAMSAAETLSHLAVSKAVEPVVIAGLLATARGRTLSTAFGTTAEALVDVASDDFEAVLARAGGAQIGQPQTWAEGAARLQRMCVQHEQSLVDAARGGRTAVAHPNGGSSTGWEGDETRTSMPVSTTDRAAAAQVIRGLASSATVMAEAAAAKLADPIHEVRRLADSPHGYAAAAAIFSDGSVQGKLPAKGERSDY